MGQQYVMNDSMPAKLKNPVIPKGLWLVKDQGVYLMSNGEMEAGKTPTSEGLIVYANGFNPEVEPDCFGKARYHLGGDDFVEAIDLDQIEEVLNCRKEGYLMIEVTEIEIGLGWSPIDR